MSRVPRTIGMAPPHPGEFIRDEILDELGLSVSEAADVLGVRACQPVRPRRRQGRAVP